MSKHFFILFIVSFFTGCSPKDSNETARKKTKVPEEQPHKKVIKLSAPQSIEAAPELIALFEKAYQKIGYRMEIIKLPAKRSLMESLENSAIDGEVLRAKEIENLMPNLIRIKVPIFKGSVVCYVKDQSIRINKIEDLSKYKVGIIDGHYLVMKKLENIKVSVTTTGTQTLQMLNENRIDIAVMLDIVGKKCIKELKLDSIHQSGPPLMTAYLYHFINKKYEKLVPELTKVLAELTGNEPEL